MTRDPDEGDVQARQGFVEVLHCVRGPESRSYRMRAIPGGAELWRVTIPAEGSPQSIKESDFRSSEEAGAFLEELQRALIASGWRQRS